MKKWIYFIYAGLLAAGWASCALASEVKVVKTSEGWQLLKDSQPFFIKGVCYSGLSQIGKSLNENSMRDWMIVDDDHDGRNDMVYQVWLDENRNNKQDKNEKPVGDFKLLKEMGANTIRLYHHPSGDPDVQAINPGNLLYNHPPNKKLLREIYKQTGPMIMMGDLLGAYTIGSGLS